jgi:hypothetical protein
MSVPAAVAVCLAAVSAALGQCPPVLEGQLDTPGLGRDVWVVEDLVYFADEGAVARRNCLSKDGRPAPLAAPLRIISSSGSRGAIRSSRSAIRAAPVFASSGPSENRPRRTWIALP